MSGTIVAVLTCASSNKSYEHAKELMDKKKAEEGEESNKEDKASGSDSEEGSDAGSGGEGVDEDGEIIPNPIAAVSDEEEQEEAEKEADKVTDLDEKSAAEDDSIEADAPYVPVPLEEKKNL